MLERLKKLGILISCCYVICLSPISADEGSKDVALIARAQTFAKENKVAVVVGISNYDQVNTGFRRLYYAAIDAQKLSGTLQGRGYLNPKRLLNAQASKSLILNAIRNAGARIKRGEGTLVFAFSGHGMVSAGENYLATSDSVATRLTQTGLSVSEIVQAIKQTGVKRAILFLDACRNDPVPGIKAGGMDGFLSKNYGQGIQILYATAQNEVSWEHNNLQRGVFSYFLTLGLQGEAAYDNGLITFNSLATYIEQEVVNWTNGKVPQTQRPFRNSVGETRGDFVLARLGGRPLLIPDPVPKPEMVNIPAGGFKMGCDPTRDNVKGSCYDNEKPAHQVNISAFKMAKTEVTFEQWDACTAAGACIKADDKGWGRGNRPVINVNWSDIQVYIQWLNQQTGKTYQLPTEAQWEYAARANRNTAFPWGDSISCNNANYGSFSHECKTDRTKPVGQYFANAFGLHDTSGNVWEWTQDCWHGNYQGASANGAAKTSCPSVAGPRVLRGCSWDSFGLACRSALRVGGNTDIRRPNIGFRLSLGL